MDQEDFCAPTLDALDIFLQKQRELLSKTQVDLQRLRELKAEVNADPEGFVRGICEGDSGLNDPAFRLDEMAYGLSFPKPILWGAFNGVDVTPLQTLHTSLQTRTLLRTRPLKASRFPPSDLQTLVRRARKDLVEPVFEEYGEVSEEEGENRGSSKRQEEDPESMRRRLEHEKIRELKRQVRGGGGGLSLPRGSGGVFVRNDVEDESAIEVDIDDDGVKNQRQQAVSGEEGRHRAGKGRGKGMWVGKGGKGVGKGGGKAKKAGKGKGKGKWIEKGGGKCPKMFEDAMNLDVDVDLGGGVDEEEDEDEGYSHVKRRRSYSDCYNATLDKEKAKVVNGVDKTRSEDDDVRMDEERENEEEEEGYGYPPPARASSSTSYTSYTNTIGDYSYSNTKKITPASADFEVGDEDEYDDGDPYGHTASGRPVRSSSRATTKPKSKNDVKGKAKAKTKTKTSKVEKAEEAGKAEKPKPETYKQAWSDEEQRFLERLLEEIPDGEKFRWQKISKAMGGRRTPRQVASRVQKYFEKLKRFGVGVP